MMRIINMTTAKILANVIQAVREKDGLPMGALNG
jgi:hypothetical protein